MKTRIPVYKEKQQTYHVGSCQSLVDAAEAGKIRFEGLARGNYPGRPLPDFALPGLRAIGYWDSRIQQDWGLEWHRNEGLEITFLQSGTLPFWVADKEYSLRPGDMTITRPWQPHRVGNPNIPASRLHWLILDLGVRRPNQDWKWPKWCVLTPQDLEDLTIMLRQYEHPIWQTTKDVQQCFRRISKAINADRHGSSASRLTAYINELFISILEMLRHNDIKLDPSLSSSTRMVDMFLADLRDSTEQLSFDWSVSTMAEHCGLGQTRFRHYCKEMTNMSPSQYLEQCRVDAAAKLLVQQPKMSVTEIAMACGFSSSQYFATVFRRHHKCSPRSFRQQAGA
jgi:AraC family 4-hydroxyphenylacetate 3-monooxygenase operon regulatory protein